MFQRELDLAVDWGREMLQHVDAAAEGARSAEVSSAVFGVLDAGWRMESALGEFLAIEEVKRRASGLEESTVAARRSFEVLKPALAGAGSMHRRPEGEMKDWVEAFRPQAEVAMRAALEARRVMPPASSHRIAAPLSTSGRKEDSGAVVALAQAEDPNVSVGDVEGLVRTALEPLGGIGRFVQPGNTVLLKPNQTMFMLADEGSTTDPRVVAALARLCFEAGAGRVIVGESSGGGSSSEQVMHVTGVKAMAERAGAQVVDFHTCEQREIEIPDGKILQRLLLPVPLLDADVIINVPKMKTHNWDWISGALKNWVGVVRPDVREKHHDADTFDEYVDLLTRVPPHLNVMDALVRGVGNGPGANRGEFYGAILASADPVAMDAVAAQLLGFDPAGIGFVQVAWQRGLGEGDPRRIAVAGAPLERAFKPAEPPVMGVDMYDANVIVGTRLTRAGTLGHFKSMADVLEAMGVWELVRRLHGRPTVLLGDAEDPLMEDHLREGPYVVIDDVAPDRYKHHPGVYFVPGHPVLHNLETELLVGLRIPRLGKTAQHVMGMTRALDARLEFDTPQPLVPVARGALGVARLMPVWMQVAVSAGSISALLAAGALGLRQWARRPAPRRRRR